jgi:hypothetical protein
MVLCKEDRAKELATMWLGKAHQCPQCSYGPVEHFACGDLSESQMNKCPQCQFEAPNIRSWPAWNGTLPQSMQVMEGRFNCPYCRKDSAMSSAFGEETIFCTKCTKMGHLAKDCRYSQCQAGGGHAPGKGPTLPQQQQRRNPQMGEGAAADGPQEEGRSVQGAGLRDEVRPELRRPHSTVGHCPVRQPTAARVHTLAGRAERADGGDRWRGQQQHSQDWQLLKTGTGSKAGGGGAKPGRPTKPGYTCKHCGMPSGMLGCHWSENCLKRTK